MNVFRLVLHQHWPIFYQVLCHPPYFHIGGNDIKPTDILLNNIVQPTDALSCKDCNCTRVDHKEALQKYYDDTMTAIRCAGQNTMKMRNQHNGNNFNLPGWKEFASDLYSMSRDLYFMWKDSGSPRQGELVNMKNRAKARFKGAMRFIRCNEDALRKDSLAKKTAV